MKFHIAVKDRFRLTTLILSVSLIAILGSASNPTPAKAIVFSCPITKSVLLPSKSQYQDLVSTSPNPRYGGPKTGIRTVVAVVNRSCLSKIKAGTYAIRAKYTTTLRLNSAWPGGGYSESYSEYPSRYEDATWYTQVASWQPEDIPFIESEWPVSGSPERKPHRFRSWGGISPLGYSGSTFRYLPLSELCFGEICKFNNEYIGLFGDPTGDAIIGIITEISMCFPYAPQPEDETVRCSRGKFAHPGTFGMRVTVSGSLEFEALLESSMRSSPR